jgi:hypothetical protein
MGNMPGWAFGLGALLKGPEYIKEGYGLYQGIRDDIRAGQDQERTNEVLNDFADASGPDDYRFINRSLGTYGINDPKRFQEVQVYGKGLLKDSLAEEQQITTQNQLAAFQKEAAASGTDLVSYGIAHPDRVPMTALQGVHSALSTFATGAEKEIERRYKDTKEQDKQKNISDFQGAISGLTGQSQSPVDLKRFASRGGYDTFPGVESDIRQAAAAYPVPAEVVNKEVDNARMTYKDTYLPTTSGKVGRTSYTGQTNLLGDFRKDAQSVAPVTNVHNNMYGGAGPGAVESWSDRIAAGQATITDVPRQTKDAVMADLGKRYPKIDLLGLRANQKYATAQGNLQSRALIQGVEPLYDKLEKAGMDLNSSRFPIYNKGKNYFAEHAGDPRIVAFNNLRDDVIAESERVLLGSGVLSDSKYLRAVQNLNSAQSPAQMKAAIQQVKLTVNSRLHALDKNPFPNAGVQPKKDNAPRFKILEVK